MPLPEPTSTESHDEFIDRCMSDDAMEEEYDDEGQRLAVCESLWDEEENSMAGKIERRCMPLAVELREDGDSPKIGGHAAIFDTPAEIWGFEEVVRRNAFADSVKADDVRALWNHNPDVVLGRTKSGTLTLTEDDTGLAIEIDPPDTQAARDLMVSMERGDVDQMSFGFGVIEERWTTREDDLDLRELLKVRLYDVSPVTFPAYDETDVAVRAALRNAPHEVIEKQIKHLRTLLPGQRVEEAAGQRPTVEFYEQLLQLERSKT